MYKKGNLSEENHVIFRSITFQQNETNCYEGCKTFFYRNLIYCANQRCGYIDYCFNLI